MGEFPPKDKKIRVAEAPKAPKKKQKGSTILPELRQDLTKTAKQRQAETTRSIFRDWRNWRKALSEKLKKDPEKVIDTKKMWKIIGKSNVIGSFYRLSKRRDKRTKKLKWVVGKFRGIITYAEKGDGVRVLSKKIYTIKGKKYLKVRVNQGTRKTPRSPLVKYSYTGYLPLASLKITSKAVPRAAKSYAKKQKRDLKAVARKRNEKLRGKYIKLKGFKIKKPKLKE